LARGKGRDHVNCSLGSLGSSHRLAVDRNHLRRRACQRRDPRDKAALKGLGIKRREDIAEVIVNWR